MYARRALPSITVALMLSLFGVPTDPPGPFVESVDARTPLVSGIGDVIRSSSSSKASLDEIGPQKRGHQDVTVRATTGQSGLICHLTIKYGNGNFDSPDDVTADSNGVCTIRFDVTEAPSAVGTATAKLRVTTRNDIARGRASRSFSVK